MLKAKVGCDGGGTLALGRLLFGKDIRLSYAECTCSLVFQYEIRCLIAEKRGLDMNNMLGKFRNSFVLSLMITVVDS